MKILNKKLISASILIFALILLLSTLTYAKPFTEAFRGGLIQINDFFVSEQYKVYAKAIDFFFFSLLFIAIYMMGVRYAFKEVKRPETVIAILLGLMTGFLMVLGGWSATLILPYLNWLLYTLLFILYWWLLKGINNKFWRFILALLLTLLTIALLQGLFGTLTAPDISAPDTGFFKSFFDAFKGIQFPGVSMPGVPDYARDLFGPVAPPSAPGIGTLPPTTTPTAEAPGKGGIFGSGVSWWWVLLIPLLAGAGFGAYRFWPRGRERRERGAPPPPPPEERPRVEETIDDLIREITECINKKIAVLKKIRTIIKEKEKRRQTVQGFIDLYHKKIYDDAFYLDPQHEAHQKLMSEHTEVTEILKIERELEKDLLELMGIEDDLIGRSALPLGNWEREKFSGRLIEVTSIKTQKEWYGKVFIWYWYVKMLQKHIENEYTARLVNDKEIAPELTVPRGIPDFYGKIFAKLEESFKKLKNGDGLLAKIKRQIIRYYVWTKEEEEIERKIKLYSDVKELEKWLKKGWATRWHDIKDKQGARLVKVFKDERNMFMGTKQEPGLFRNLLQQLILLQHLRALLNALKSERVSMTQLQDLYINKLVNNQWVDVTTEAKRQPGLILNVPHSAHTRIQEGIGPFRVACYVDKQRRGEIKRVEKKHDEIRFTFDEIGITAPGTYNITFVCISIAEKVYERRDRKSVRIYVQGVSPYGAPPYGPPYAPPYGPYAPPYGAPYGVPPRRPPSRIKVLMVSPTNPNLSNGVSVVVDNLSKALISLGVEVDILFKWYGYPYYLIPSDGASSQTFAAVEDLLRSIRPRYYDFIHSHSFVIAERIPHNNPIPQCVQILQHLNVPLAYTIHSLDKHEAITCKWVSTALNYHLNWVGNELQPTMLNLSNVIIQLTRTYTQLTEEMYPGSNYGAKTVIIPNGIDLRSITPRNRPPSEDINLLYVGRLERRKGMYELCIAFSELLKTYPKLKLHIAGEGLPRTVGPEDNRRRKYEDFTAEAMRRILRRLKVHNDRYKFYGDIRGEQKEQLFALGDFVIIPSYFETFCLVGLEAIARKRPLIATDVPALKEVYIDTGLAYPIRIGELRYNIASDTSNYVKFRVRKIIEAVSYCIKHRDECEQRAEMAFGFLRSNANIFDWLEIARKTKEVYESLINTGRVPHIEITIPRMSPPADEIPRPSPYAPPTPQVHVISHNDPTFYNDFFEALRNGNIDEANAFINLKRNTSGIHYNDSNFRRLAILRELTDNIVRAQNHRASFEDCIDELKTKGAKVFGQNILDELEKIVNETRTKLRIWGVRINGEDLRIDLFRPFGIARGTEIPSNIKELVLDFEFEGNEKKYCKAIFYEVRDDRLIRNRSIGNNGETDWNEFDGNHLRYPLSESLSEGLNVLDFVFATDTNNKRTWLRTKIIVPQLNLSTS